MVDASKILTVRRAQNELTEENAAEIFQHYLDYTNKEDISRVVMLEEIAAKDFVLDPKRYIQYHQEEQEPYEVIKARFLAACQEVRDAEQAFTQLMNS